MMGSHLCTRKEQQLVITKLNNNNAVSFEILRSRARRASMLFWVLQKSTVYKEDIIDGRLMACKKIVYSFVLTDSQSMYVCMVRHTARV